MTRLIFRFKRTLVTPTFPASSFTDVSTVPTRRHLSRALTEPSLPPRRFHLLLETLFNAAFSSLDCPFNRDDDTPSSARRRFGRRVPHTRCVPFAPRLGEAKDLPKNFAGLRMLRKFVECCGYQTTVSLAASLVAVVAACLRARTTLSCSTSYPGTSSCVHKRCRPNDGNV